MEDHKEYIGYGIIAMILAIFGAIGVINTYNHNSTNESKYYLAKAKYPFVLGEAKKAYLLELKKHEEDILKIQKENEERLSVFEKHEYPLYLTKSASYKKEVARLNQIDIIHDFRLLSRKKFFSTVIKPSVHSINSKNKRGVSEESFFDYLKNKFNGIVFQNLALTEPLNGISYTPDFTVHDRSIGFCIDIEIDEPYIGKNGKPIHFLESDFDKKRDDYFNSKGWVVIRFTEKQVIEHPNKCCDIIAEVINEICQGIIKFNYSTDLTLLPIGQWTKDEAHEMAFKSLRNTYLNPELAKKLEEEDHENSENYVNDISKREVNERETYRNQRQRDEYWNSGSDNDLPF